MLLYDLVTSSIWSDSQSRPGFLIHDSLVFEGVDERQVAGALQLAQQVATAKGIQYICMLNSDQVPTHDLPDEFNLRSFTRLVLNDQPETASLLGIRF